MWKSSSKLFYVNLGSIFFLFLLNANWTSGGSNRIHSLKYLRSTTLCSKDIRIRNISLWQQLNSFRLSQVTKVIIWNIKSLQHQLAKLSLLKIVLFLGTWLITKSSLFFLFSKLSRYMIERCMKAVPTRRKWRTRNIEIWKYFYLISYKHLKIL